MRRIALVLVAVLSLVAGLAARASAQDVSSDELAAPPPGGATAIPPPPPSYGDAPAVAPNVAAGFPVRLTATHPGLVFHRVADDGTTSPLCAAPCQLTLAPGRYQFAIGRGTGTPLRIDEGAVSITGPTALLGDYHSHNGARIGGYIALGVGAVNVAQAVILGFVYADLPGIVLSEAIVGTIVGLVCLAVGLPLVFMNDGASAVGIPFG